MKRLLSRIFFLTLICSAALFSACSSDDAPAVPVDPPVDPQPVPPSDRDVLAAKLKKDAAVLADQLDFSAIETTSDATRQLLSLMGRGRYFMRDMQTAMVMITARNISERKLPTTASAPPAARWSSSSPPPSVTIPRRSTS